MFKTDTREIIQDAIKSARRLDMTPSEYWRLITDIILDLASDDDVEITRDPDGDLFMISVKINGIVYA